MLVIVYNTNPEKSICIPCVARAMMDHTMNGGSAVAFFCFSLRIQPFCHLQIVVLVEGEIEGRVTIASTASEYPLAIFRIFRSLDRKWKMFVEIIPNPYEERRRRMANRKRNIQMKFYVTENKKRLIDERIKLLTSLPHSISCSFGNELKDEICNSSS